MSLLSTNAELDEFDVIPDPFADEDVDWTQILAAPATTQAIPTTSRPPSPEYFNSDTLDDSVLAQLDMIESTQLASTSSHAPASSSTAVPQSTHTTNATIQLSHLFHINISPSPASPQRPKRPRMASDTPSRKSKGDGSPQSGSRRKRRKGIDLILAGFEGELSCPICFDIFVATHLFNPCGHSFCGDCGWQWLAKNKNAGCPVCRTPLANTPMTKNISMDKMVDMHIQMLCSDDEDWRVNGRKLVEFQGRQKKWKDSVAERTKTVVKVWVVSDESDEDFDDSGEDSEQEYWEEDIG